MLYNIFENIPDELSEELVETLCSSDAVRIERIVSYGHSSDPDFWYQQEQNEFVILLSGSAQLELEDKTISMKPGDYLNIPAQLKHRVATTAKDEKSIWLCVFY